MFNTSDIDCNIFRMLTNRSDTNLPHPTASSFDKDQWEAAAGGLTLSDRDKRIYDAGIFLGEQIKILRSEYINKLFDQISRETIIRMAVAVSNREFLTLTRLHKEATRPYIDAGDPVHISSIANHRFQANRYQAETTVDNLNGTIVDSLPHWFAQAKKTDRKEDDRSVDFNVISAKGAAFLSIEHSFRAMWQQILWNPWGCDFSEASPIIRPDDLKTELYWEAWQQRENNVTVGNAIAAEQVVTRTGNRGYESIIKKTVKKIVKRGAKLDISFTTNKVALNNCRKMVTITDKSYLSPFIETSLSKTSNNISIRVLVEAWAVMHDFVNGLIGALKRREIRIYADIHALSLGCKRKTIFYVLSQCLKLSGDDINIIIDMLSSNPDDVSSCFAQGVWHRPLIAFGEDEYFIVAIPFLSGGPVYRVQQWLHESGITSKKKKKSLPSIIFENSVRESAQRSLSKNSEIKNYFVLPHALEAEEEIDLIIRIGNTVIVGEVKCFIQPSEPIEKYDHIRKLEEAAEQVERKADWLRNNSRKTMDFIGPIADGAALNFIPMVIINQSTGVGMKFSEAVVVDARFLAIYLSGGTFYDGGAWFVQQDSLLPRSSFMYSTEREAEANLITVLCDPPTLRQFYQSCDWTVTYLPAAGDMSICVYMPFLDEKRIGASMYRGGGSMFG